MSERLTDEPTGMSCPSCGGPAICISNPREHYHKCSGCGRRDGGAEKLEALDNWALIPLISEARRMVEP